MGNEVDPSWKCGVGLWELVSDVVAGVEVFYQRFPTSTEYQTDHRTRSRGIDMCIRGTGTGVCCIITAMDRFPVAASAS